MRYYDRNNAHNYLLWLGAELGLIGLALFVWLIVSALARSWAYVRTRQADYAALGTLAGLTAFIITWSIGQPLGVPQVAYTFWIVLGIAAAQSRREAIGAATGAWLWLRARVVPVATVLLLASAVPARAYRSIWQIDLGRIAYGFGEWEMKSDGTRFRSLGSRATFFVNASALAIDVPFATDPLAGPLGAQVDIVVDGQAIDTVMLNDEVWRAVRLVAPVAPRRFWRVDLRVSPIWISRAASANRTAAGVVMGEISVVAERPPSN